jgi:hypothetical protein
MKDFSGLSYFDGHHFSHWGFFTKICIVSCFTKHNLSSSFINSELSKNVTKYIHDWVKTQKQKAGRGGRKFVCLWQQNIIGRSERRGENSQ